jgi:hypothetical protein
VGWHFGKTPREEWRDKPRAITSAIPRDDDRAGPAPPPPRTAQAPGVTIYAFGSLLSPHLQRLAEGPSGFFLEGEEGQDRSSALLVLEVGGAAGGGGGGPAGGGGGRPPPPPPPPQFCCWVATF